MSYKSHVRLLASASVAALMVAAAGCASHTDESTSSASSRLVTSGPATGDLFVHGTISRDGRPVRGARVVVELWPTATETATSRKTPRMSWDTRPSTTDADGGWSISVDPAQVPRAYFSRARDHLDFNLQVFDRAQLATWSATMYRIRPVGVWRTAAAGAASPVLDVSLDLDRGRVVLTDSLGKTIRSAIAVRRAS